MDDLPKAIRLQLILVFEDGTRQAGPFDYYKARDHDDTVEIRIGDQYHQFRLKKRIQDFELKTVELHIAERIS